MTCFSYDETSEEFAAIHTVYRSEYRKIVVDFCAILSYKRRGQDENVELVDYI